ncbi:TM2 domain-containing protein [Silvanigrella aquatica]|uniref:TM2 domain-containing protein n=1 Tax=Silvanigrella aquatica TaxID=1915309 RepID=A0A1L4D166_9BACT|nr:TM2 domain-containing protein [Silvanigrella aquatica]APJ03955.1 hypothetical protein AXG55_08565 [Silvanigrella aquatica]
MSLKYKNADENFCSDCGQIIKLKAEICPHCGCRKSVNVSCNKNKVVAGVFALLLGGFGGHKFYLGKTGMGILYFIFFWTLIPAIISFIEGIIYLTMTDENFNQKYCL